MIKAFLTDIYGGSMPGWPLGSGNNSDEGFSGVNNLGVYQKGGINVDNTNVTLNYTNIEKCNFLRDQLTQVPASVLDPSLNQQYVGEAKFWRAWAYWGMVASVGGVPLILHTQDYTKPASLAVPRNKTSECITQIVADLDSAAMLLPGTYSDPNDYGRITKAAAMGLKGRILMTWASPLFNATGDPTRWQNAYTACLAAVNEATTDGYGLNPNYRSIWYSGQGNPELIMVNQYFYPDHYMNFAPIRPIPYTNGSTGNDQPLLSMLLAYPKRDGSPMEFDTTQLRTNPAYNAQFLTDFYTNRDDRFYATVWVGGTPYPTPDIVPGQTGKETTWDVFQWSATNNAYVNIEPLINGSAAGGDGVGFCERKGLDTLMTAATVVNGAAGAKSFWSPMRFAELLMNYGECANEIGKPNEALSVLYQIRARANVAAGPSNNYGITAASQADIRTAYINERFVEFAFEGFRLADLRRWKRYDILNSEGYRHGLHVALNVGAPLPSPALTSTIMDPTIRANFSAVYVNSLDTDPTVFYNLDLHHWFWALSPSQISLEPSNLPQNNEWGGTFDPLQ
ncbi:RagB/SusD family nutrient uptake outer membrane protein [Dinghuibacter silviterrae]|nr:RagB/SusD family nutrient uptake outer membrane protein [Dinghuibacter silviterrae]